jgi:hypothetical protein
MRNLLNRVQHFFQQRLHRKRWFEIPMNKQEIKQLVVGICADGDFALKGYRSDFTIEELKKL